MSVDPIAGRATCVHLNRLDGGTDSEILRKVRLVNQLLKEAHRLRNLLKCLIRRRIVEWNDELIAGCMEVIDKRDVLLVFRQKISHRLRLRFGERLWAGPGVGTHVIIVRFPIDVVVAVQVDSELCHVSFKIRRAAVAFYRAGLSLPEGDLFIVVVVVLPLVDENARLLVHLLNIVRAVNVDGRNE